MISYSERDYRAVILRLSQLREQFDTEAAAYYQKYPAGVGLDDLSGGAENEDTRALIFESLRLRLMREEITRTEEYKAKIERYIQSHFTTYGGIL